jgi:hypothetical protein
VLAHGARAETGVLLGSALLWLRLPPAGYACSVTSGRESSWRLRIPGPWGTALQLALIALKLAGIIDWSWWWVLAPLWCTVTLFAALTGGFLLVLVVQKRTVRVRARSILARLVFPTGQFPGTPRRRPAGGDENW